MNKLYFEIADLILLVEADSDRIDSDLVSIELMDFRCDRVDEPDVVVRFETVPYEDRNAKVLVDDPMLMITETYDAYVVQYKNAQTVSCYVNEKQQCITRVYLTKESGADTEVKYTIRDAFFFHMQKHGRIAVHSASILYKDKVWLFSARSGVGKSTHVSRWHDAGYDFEDFNGDLAICYLDGEAVVAAGAPWCGTSEIFCNQKAPLGGVLFLERALEDRVRGMALPESMARLAARCLTPNWNRELMEANIETAGMIIPRVVTGVLECTNRMEAAHVAKQFIDAYCF